MSLPIEYFTDQTHITDLEKLQYEKLYYIIRIFRDELEKFKLKGLIIACNEMKDLIKDFRFILNGYIRVINKQFFYLKEEIEELLKEMDKIENNLDKIKAVDELGNKCLYKMQILYDSLNDFIYWESCFWDKIDLEKKEIIIKKMAL